MMRTARSRARSRTEQASPVVWRTVSYCQNYRGIIETARLCNTILTSQKNITRAPRPWRGPTGEGTPKWSDTDMGIEFMNTSTLKNRICTVWYSQVRPTSRGCFVLLCFPARGGLQQELRCWAERKTYQDRECEDDRVCMTRWATNDEATNRRRLVAVPRHLRWSGNRPLLIVSGNVFTWQSLRSCVMLRGSDGTRGAVQSGKEGTRPLFSISGNSFSQPTLRSKLGLARKTLGRPRSE